MTYSEEQYNSLLVVCRSYKNDYDKAFERLKAQQREIERLKAENARLTEKLGQVLLSIDTVKEMNAMCNIAEQIKQAKINALNELKEKHSTSGNTFAGWITFVPNDDIDELIKEYENAEDKG